MLGRADFGSPGQGAGHVLGVGLDPPPLSPCRPRQAPQARGRQCHVTSTEHGLSEAGGVGGQMPENRAIEKAPERL